MHNIEAWPQTFNFVPEKTGLLIIDPQVDFMEPGGWAHAYGLDVTAMAPVIPIIAKILTSFRRAGMPVIYTREGYRPDLADLPDWKKVHQSPQYGDHGPRGRYMITGEPCNDIIAELAPQANEPVIDKPGAGAFYATLLEQILRLRGVTHLVVVGVTTDVCVNMTIREANDRGYDVLLVEDATASYNAYFTDAVISMLRTGIACKCSRSELVLATINALGGPN